MNAKTKDPAPETVDDELGPSPTGGKLEDVPAEAKKTATKKAAPAKEAAPKKEAAPEPGPEVPNPVGTEAEASIDKTIAIIKTIKSMNIEDPVHFDADNGEPRLVTIQEIMGEQITPDQLAEAWEVCVQEQADKAAAAERDTVEAQVITAPTEAIQQQYAWGGRWAVRDGNATKGERTHQPIEGKTITLNAQRPVPMPRSWAVKFLGEDGFTVYNEFGQPVAAGEFGDLRAGEAQVMKLNADQVVANIRELSIGALLVRVQRMPGGELFTAEHSREQLENFYAHTRGKMLAGRPDEWLQGDPDLLPDNPEAVEAALAGD